VELMNRDYVSPDGALRFLVRATDGDLTMGFDGCPSHTHGDILAISGATGETPEEATERHVNDLISSKLIIAVATVQGKIRDIWITDDPSSHLRYCPPDETIVFRRWDGTVLPQPTASQR
jgi:hypothetical protein